MPSRRNFTEEEFLIAIKESTCHFQAMRKLGYSKAIGIKQNSKYKTLFCKLKPNIFHFKIKQKYNIPHKANTKEYKQKYLKIRRKEDIYTRISDNLRNRLRAALKNNQKIGSAISDLGCSVEKFKLWLEMHWSDGMSWDNYGEWHLDHIKPLSKVDLTSRAQFLEVCHFSNIQPLWAKDNIRKSNKF